MVKLVAALRLADHAAPQLLALRTLKPSLRTLDLYTRLLISQEPMSLGSEEDAGSITLGRLSKRTALGDWLASAIANVEEPERRHEMDQERVGATVGRVSWRDSNHASHFASVRSLTRCLPSLSKALPIRKSPHEPRHSAQWSQDSWRIA